MTQLQLTTELQNLLPRWRVTLDEAYMINISADDLLACDGFVYVEELDTQSASFAGYGKDMTRTVDVYFCRFADYETTAVERETIRQNSIRPAIDLVERWLLSNYGINYFNEDKFPRGFDANEVLIHVSFQLKEKVC